MPCATPIRRARAKSQRRRLVQRCTPTSPTGSGKQLPLVCRRRLSCRSPMMAIKQASHPSKVIVSAREGQRARAAALEAIADLNEDIAREDDPDFDPAATHDPEQDVAADAAAPEDQAASDETPGEETGGEEESAEEPAPLTEPPAEEPAPDKQAEAPRKWKLKVNGRELELTEEEVLARAQKVESADQYLAEAARVRHEQNLAPAARSTPATLPHPSDEE